MSIKEAAELVLQASSIATGGDVFLLDMGEPIKILDLAEQMIYLSGKTIKDKNNPQGDIEVSFTGLREGEKLFEELLIDAEAQKTAHKLIYKSNEKYIPYQELIPKIETLKNHLLNLDLENALSLSKELVPEWDTNII